MKRLLCRTAVLILTFAFASSAWAQWSSNPAINLPLADNNNGSDQVQPKLAPLSSSGGYVSWFDANPDSPPPIGYSVFYQRLNEAGYEKFQHDGLEVAQIGRAS